jgi:hypothetical protein
MSKNALHEMGTLSDADGGVVVMVNLGRSHMTSLETMVNERVAASRLTDVLKVKTLAGIKQGEQMNQLKDILYGSPENIQNTAIAEMQQAAKNLVGESGGVEWNLGSHRRDPGFAKGVVAICKDPEAETARIGRELNESLDQTLTSLGIDAKAREEMKLNTPAMKLAFVNAVKEVTDPSDNFSSVRKSMEDLQKRNYGEFWGGNTPEQVDKLLDGNYEAYEKLEEGWNEKVSAITKHLDKATKLIAPHGQIPFKTLQENVGKAENLEKLSQAGAVLKPLSQEHRLKLAGQIETSLETIDFSNRTIGKIADLENNPNCKILNSKDGNTINKEIQSTAPRESVRTALQNESANQKQSQVDTKVQVGTGGTAKIRY